MEEGTERDGGRGWGIGTLREAPAGGEADPVALCGHEGVLLRREGTRV